MSWTLMFHFLASLVFSLSSVAYRSSQNRNHKFCNVKLKILYSMRVAGGGGGLIVLRFLFIEYLISGRITEFQSRIILFCLNVASTKRKCMTWERILWVELGRTFLQGCSSTIASVCPLRMKPYSEFLITCKVKYIMWFKTLKMTAKLLKVGGPLLSVLVFKRRRRRDYANLKTCRNSSVFGCTPRFSFR